jgi:hypothetical protein
MTIQRITVKFVAPDGSSRGSATGSVDRRADLIREARAELEAWKSKARREGDPSGDVEYILTISDAPAAAVWSPKG